MGIKAVVNDEKKLFNLNSIPSRSQRSETNAPIAVLGVGNLLLRDEGVGVHAVEVLRRDYEFREQVILIDGGTMGLDLLPFIEGREKVLILDAVNLKKEPGSIEVIEDGDIPAFLSSKLSVHQIGLPDVLSAVKIMDMTPSRMTLIGIQPERIETGITLSEKVYKRFDDFLNAAIAKLKEWGVEPECIQSKDVTSHPHESSPYLWFNRHVTMQ